LAPTLAVKAGIRRKLVILTVPALVVAVLLFATFVEVWVRATWEPRRGRPGFFLSDAARGQRLAAGYDGWFAGVPVHINSLELRDQREYSLAKAPNTFRILVLGDSVTFGHGSVSEHTYPYLLEQRLKAWQPRVDWQVWNAAVPGYDTSQELAHLLEVGDRFQPDLVIVGFYENDLVGNLPVRPPGWVKRVTARALSTARRHVYSFELYKRLYLTLAWRLFASDEYRLRLAHLGTEESLLTSVADATTLKEQQLTNYERLTDQQVGSIDCVFGMKPNPGAIAAIQADPGYAVWLDAVRGFQLQNRQGRFSIAFFLNDVPPVCPDGDVFYDGGSKAIDQFYTRTIGDGLPVASTLDAFMHTRPSQMPNAVQHAIGNANAVKADVLFEFLRDRALPARLRDAAGQPPS
jgi:lysophospholipase L1-like esterase